LAFDQRANFKQAILNRKARIAEIDAILHRPIPIFRPGRGFSPRSTGTGRRDLAIEREHLLVVVKDLEQQLARLGTPAPRIRPALAQCSTPAAKLPESSHGNVTKGRANEVVLARHPRLPKYRSHSKLAIRRILLEASEPERLRVLDICRLMDDHAVAIPHKWEQKNVETFEDAYRDRTLRQQIHRLVDKVKADLKRSGLF
jgi:hypothetical protein